MVSNSKNTLLKVLVGVALVSGFLWSVLREPTITDKKSMKIISKTAVAGYSAYSSRIGKVMQTFPAKAPSYALILKDLKGSRTLEVNVSEALGNQLRVGEVVVPRIEERGIPYIFPLYQVNEVKKK